MRRKLYIEFYIIRREKPKPKKKKTEKAQTVKVSVQILKVS